MDAQDLQPLIATLAAEVRAFVRAEIESTRKDVLEIVRAEFAALPKPRDGIDGKDGKDAEPIDEEAITREIWSAVQARIEPGPKGDPGEKGEQGPPVDLVQVSEIIDDTVKAHLAALPTPRDGIDGRDGQDGQDGKDGGRGETGRDALQLDILSVINPDRSYSRGTYAKAFGGLVRAVRATDRLTEDKSLIESGWECIVSGLQSIAISAKDGRHFVLQAITTEGIQRMEFSVPAILERGVFKAGGEYEAGDVVTYDGSTWVAQQTTSDVPATSKEWRLFVRKGRDGRDAVPRPEIRDEPVRLR